MLFNSFNYLIFFPIVILFYFVIPAKNKQLRNFWLLLISYFFYMNWNAKYAILLFASTFITYICGLLIGIAKEKQQNTYAKCYLAGGFIINLTILFFFKYSNFFLENLNKLNHLLGQDKTYAYIDILLPVGISFYIFQALGYTMDVYRGTTKPQRSLLRYMLFVSFFPQLVAGPIERSGNLMQQFDEKHEFDVERIRTGLLTMAWGLFMKVVIADNLSSYVNSVYGNYMGFTGVEIMLATFAFAIQIYCDFGGYTYIAIGSAKVLGFSLMENFHAPYFALSIDDFWKRWHISLTGWFRDYLYIPLGGNRKGTVRKYINVLIVFVISGMWHGAAWPYIIWGLLNGIYLVLSGATINLRKLLKQKWKVDEKRFSYRMWCRIGTFLMVSFSWIFFRAEGIRNAIAIISQIIVSFQFPKLFGLAFHRTGFSVHLTVAILLALLLLGAVDYMIDKNIDVCQWLLSQGALFRWIVYTILLFSIMAFGAYGLDFTQTEFIYFQF